MQIDPARCPRERHAVDRPAVDRPADPDIALRHPATGGKRHGQQQAEQR